MLYVYLTLITLFVLYCFYFARFCYKLQIKPEDMVKLFFLMPAIWIGSIFVILFEKLKGK